MRLPPDVSVEFYNSERDLYSAVFRALDEYPFVLTFNGDDFDLQYLYHRAEITGIRKDEVPIEAGRKVFLLKRGVHIDLYKFFFNRSIQIYAFSQKYRNITLDEVSQAILGKSKLHFTKLIGDLSYDELAKYCLNDAELTLGLTAYEDDLVMKSHSCPSKDKPYADGRC